MGQFYMKWSFSYNAFVIFHGKIFGSHNMTMLRYIQICVITRFVVKGMYCILCGGHYLNSKRKI